MKIIFLSVFLLSMLSFNAYSQDAKDNKLDGKVRSIEGKADRKFIEQDFDKAMKIYESAFKKPMSDKYSALLHLKTARLYLTLLDYPAAIPHYESAISKMDTLFTAVDICNYLDALRYSGNKLEAIKVARAYAYKDVYKEDQRYLNIVHALDYEDGFMPVGAAEFYVHRLDTVGTSYSEFWIGKMKNEYFYATSQSRFHDPNKRFYHRTKYYSLDEKSDYRRHSKPVKGKPTNLLHMVPVYLQNGPMSFSTDMTKMIVTEVTYEKSDQIRMTSGGINAFKTKLYYSEYNSKRNGWSSFELAFPQKKEASYAHPFIFNKNRSLLFSSDMDGGYGGFDLYVVHWDRKLEAWGDPINLGPDVNTEGNEISPTIHNDMLIFSSNGHVGFGGYDIYSITYENDIILKGSLYHFDYPVNTVANDFSMLHIDNNTGYIVSDRQLKDKDDVFYFERNTDYGRDHLVYGMSINKAISNGTINLAGSKGNSSSKKSQYGKSNAGGVGDAVGQYMMSVYFDFDKSFLTPAALNDLKTWLNKADLSNVKSLVIDGFADEMGTESYNYQLSKRRAETVARWLSGQGIDARATVTGRGQITVNATEKNDSLPKASYYTDSSKNAYSMWNHRIWLNRKARRVDIKAIIK